MIEGVLPTVHRTFAPARPVEETAVTVLDQAAEHLSHRACALPLCPRIILAMA